MKYFINQKINAPGFVRAGPSGGLWILNLCGSVHPAVGSAIIAAEMGNVKTYC